MHQWQWHHCSRRKNNPSPTKLSPSICRGPAVKLIQTEKTSQHRLITDPTVSLIITKALTFVGIENELWSLLERIARAIEATCQNIDPPSIFLSTRYKLESHLASASTISYGVGMGMAMLLSPLKPLAFSSSAFSQDPSSSSTYRPAVLLPVNTLQFWSSGFHLL